MRSEDRCLDDFIDWTVLKSIQEANSASMGAMEQYLLCVTRPETVGSAEQTRALLERSVTRHERVIEQLELAIEKIETTPPSNPE